MKTKVEPTNINTNNVNVNVKVEPNKSRKNNSAKKARPNWVVKAIVLGVIALGLSLLGYYIKSAGKKGKPAVIEHGTPAITGEKQ